MLDFIIKYWIEVLFSIITAGGLAFFKHYASLIKKELKSQKEEQQKAIETKIEVGNQEIKGIINDMGNKVNTLTGAMLEIQGKDFKNTCRELLSKDIITDDEYNLCEQEHKIYNALGGNHEGDALFEAVFKKYYNI